ncbi:Hypothetical protein ABZS17I87_03233 [Kosakonia cowanii]
MALRLSGLQNPTNCNRSRRPDKAKPPSGIARRMALRLSGLQNPDQL